MTVEEAIRTALKYENKVRDVYRKAAQETKSPKGRKIMEILADEEQGHVDYLDRKLKEWLMNGRISLDLLPSDIPSPERIEAGVKKLQGQVSAPLGHLVDQESDVAMLERAVEAERETSSFYERMAGELTDDAQKMFSRFLEIEHGHLAIVQAELDSVSGMSYWFGIPEFNLEIEG